MISSSISRHCSPRAFGMAAAAAAMACSCTDAPRRTTAGSTPSSRLARTELAPDGLGMPYVYETWQTFTKKNGLPDDHVFCVKVAGKSVWVGTEHGLACYESGRWRSWTLKDGLQWDVINAIDVCTETGEVWLATLGGGLIRLTAGRFDQFNQFNSGLVNDVVYGVAIEGANVWAATTAGFSRLNRKTGEWSIYTEKNAPMEEIWCYNIAYDGRGRVYGAVWGGGVLEFDCQTEHWKAYHDPDGEMEFDLYRDDGLIHIIVTAVSPVEGAMWVSSYFGVCRYDGRHWRGWMDHDSGLASNFTNFLRARSANECWFATDKGASVLADFATDTWVTYAPADDGKPGGLVRITRGAKEIETLRTVAGIPHNFTWFIDFAGDDVWVATSRGLARGVGAGRWEGLRRGSSSALHRQPASVSSES